MVLWVPSFSVQVFRGKAAASRSFMKTYYTLPGISEEGLEFKVLIWELPRN